jgi:hypothetical protein
VRRTLAHGARTADICEPGKSALTCSQMGDAVLRELDGLK